MLQTLRAPPERVPQTVATLQSAATLEPNYGYHTKNKVTTASGINSIYVEINFEGTRERKARTRYGAKIKALDS